MSDKTPLIAKITGLARIIKLRDQELKALFRRITDLEDKLKWSERKIESLERIVRMQDSDIINLEAALSVEEESTNYWHHIAVCKQMHLDEIKAGKRHD